MCIGRGKNKTVRIDSVEVIKSIEGVNLNEKLL